MSNKTRRGGKMGNEGHEKKIKVNIIELGNFKIVSETSKLREVAAVFGELVKKNRKMIAPQKEEMPNMFG